MKKAEVLETTIINGKVYPKHKRITYINEERPAVDKKAIESGNLFEEIISLKSTVE